MKDNIKSILWHAVPITLGLALCACTGPNTPRDTLICGQDGSITKRDFVGNLTMIKTRQICRINPDGTFTVGNQEDDKN